MRKLPAKADVGRIAATGERFEVADSLVRGLRLRVSAAGAKTWSLLYRTEGGFSRFDLGAFPGVSLAEARADAIIEKNAIRKKGANPQRDRALKRAADKAAKKAAKAAPLAGSVGETVAGYIATRRADLRETTLREWDRQAARIGEHFGALPVKDLTRVTVREWLGTLRSAKHPTLRDENEKPVRVQGYSANRSLALLRVALDWAADEGRIPANPAAGLKPPNSKRKKNSDILAREAKRERALSAMEVRAVLRALDEMVEGAKPIGKRYGRAPTRGVSRKAAGEATADALRLALLTGKRRGGVLGLRRSELLGLEGPEPLWELAAEREKNGEAHDVPLSPEALAIIRRRLEACDLRLGLALTEAAAKGAKPHPTIGQFLWAIHRDRKKDKEPWWSRPEHPQAWLPSKFIKRLKERAAAIHGPMKPWVPHSLRATFATLLDDQLKVDHRIVSLLLNHKLDNASTRLGYNLARKQSERRDALKEWGQKLREWKESEPGKVLSMRARA